MYTILVLAEDGLVPRDVQRIVALHDGDEVEVHVLVPADAEHNRLIEALDEVALGNLREAFDDDDESPEEAEQDAMHAVNEIITGFGEHDIEASGSVTGSDPVPAAEEAVERFDVDEVIVVTPPHLIEDALHRDWASRLRDDLDLPVLHFVSGTDRVVS